MSRSEDARWSLRRRMFGMLLAMVVGIVLLPIALGGLFLARSIDRELHALLEEEVAEMQFCLDDWNGDRSQLEGCAHSLQEEHPLNRMAWRVWNRASGRGEQFGAEEIFADLVLENRPQTRAAKPTRQCRWLVRELDAEHYVGLLLDGSPQLASLARYRWTAIVLAVGAGACTLLAGSFFARRVSAMLAAIAEGIRGGERGLSSGNAPEEIRAVADAFDATLERIHTESERARLLTAGLAHELRSPIQVLLGETEVALMRQRDPDRYRELLESHLDELRDLARAVDNLVVLCAQEENRFSRSKEIFDLAHEAELRLEREIARAERRDVHLSFDLQGPLIVRGDREAVLLALGNLITNAVQWSPSGGRVEATMSARGDELSFSVSDRGPGVPPELRRRIFEPFFRGAPSAGRRAGFGMGLALAAAAIEAHGGRIDVASRPDGNSGAVFTVTLPLAERETELVREPLANAKV